MSSEAVDGPIHFLYNLFAMKIRILYPQCEKLKEMLSLAVEKGIGKRFVVTMLTVPVGFNVTYYLADGVVRLDRQLNTDPLSVQ